MPTFTTAADQQMPGHSMHKPLAVNGFTLVEVMVAILLLGLVGLTLVRFQTFQIAGSRQLAVMAAARLEAENRIVDLMAARGAPQEAIGGVSQNAGRRWAWTAVPGPSPNPVEMPGAVTITVTVADAAGGPPLVVRHMVKSRP